MGERTRDRARDDAPKHFRTWPFVAGVTLLAVGAGVLVAGVPRPGEAFVLPADVTTTTSPDPIAVAVADDRERSEVTLGDVGAGSTDEAAATTSSEPKAPNTTDTTDTTAEPAEEPEPTSTTFAVTDEQAGSAPSPVSTSTTTTELVTESGLDLRVVVLNASGEAGVASRTSKALAALGYTETHSTDAVELATSTVVYFAPGHREEAASVAAALQLWAALEVKPSVELAVDGSSTSADLVVVLGAGE